MITVTDAGYRHQVLGSGLPVLLVFGNHHDLGSRNLGPILVELDAELQGRVVIAIADVAQCPGTAAAWGVGEKLPVLVFIRYGIPELVLRGARSKERILKDLADYL